MSQDEQSADAGVGSSSMTSGITGALLNEHAAAAFLGYTIRALQNWRRRGGGPRYVKISEKSIRYQPRDLQAWIDLKVCADIAVVDAGPEPKPRPPSPQALPEFSHSGHSA